MLQFEDEEFVRECYKGILLREPDSDGLKKSLRALRMQEITKKDLIYSLANSEEGQRKGAYLSGQRAYKIECGFRYVVRIPIIGRCIRYIYKMLRINKTVYQLSIWNANVENYVSNEFQQLTNSVSKLTDKVIDIEENEKLLLENIDFCINNINKRIESVEENLRNNNILIKKHDEFQSKYNLEDREILQRISIDLSNTKTTINKLRTTLVKNDIGYVSGINELNEYSGIEKESNNSYNAIDYFDFENKFRGDREHVKYVQKVYLKYFEGKNHVVDLGCGRGEFIELLKDSQIGAEGIDLYEPYVEYCKMRGLSVQHDDAIHFLKKQKNVDGIFVGQVVEHLQIEQIIELCRVAYEKLEKDCYLIMETPNPTTLAIFTESFYKDPSHNKPVHPETLKYIVEKVGFSQVKIIYTESSKLPYSIPELQCKDVEHLDEFNLAMKRISDLLFGSQDYAIIAKK